MLIKGDKEMPLVFIPMPFRLRDVEPLQNSGYFKLGDN